MPSAGKHSTEAAAVTAAAVAAAAVATYPAGSSDGSSRRDLDHSGGGSSPDDSIPTSMAAPVAATPTDVPTFSLPADAAVSAGTSHIYTNDIRGGSGSGGALERLWVKDASGRSVLFADVSVYTRWVLGVGNMQ